MWRVSPPLFVATFLSQLLVYKLKGGNLIMRTRSDVVLISHLIKLIRETSATTLEIVNNNKELQKTLEGLSLIEKCYKEVPNE